MKFAADFRRIARDALRVVKTHENGWCGPYFCYRKPEVWAIDANKEG